MKRKIQFEEKKSVFTAEYPLLLGLVLILATEEFLRPEQCSRPHGVGHLTGLRLGESLLVVDELLLEKEHHLPISAFSQLPHSLQGGLPSLLHGRHVESGDERASSSFITTSHGLPVLRLDKLTLLGLASFQGDFVPHGGDEVNAVEDEASADALEEGESVLDTGIKTDIVDAMEIDDSTETDLALVSKKMNE